MTGCEWCGVGPDDECVPTCPGPPLPPPKRGMRFRHAGPMLGATRRRGGVEESTDVCIVTGPSQKSSTRPQQTVDETDVVRHSEGMSTTRRTATDPVTGTVHARTTAADYTHVSIKGRTVRWHHTHAAAVRTGGRVIAVDGTATTAAVTDDAADDGATCTVVVRHDGGRCGAPAVTSFTSRRSGDRFHECADHAVGA